MMIDVLTLTANKAIQQLEDGEITSAELVEAYLSQIEKHNHQGMKLNALISVAPREKVLSIAKRLDAERGNGQTRGPLHGIPFVCKDVFTLHPDLGLPTTCGAPCFATAKPRRTAPLIQHLLDTGMILLGTANLTEFCGLKYETITPGFSPLGGQTQSPYIYGGLEEGNGFVNNSLIGGSSAGSASAVAAGFAPLAIGTECCGSLILPSTRGGLYALKCGLNTVDVRGAFHYTDVTDYVGGMAKSSDDLALFSAALMKRQEPFDIDGSLRGLKIGFVNFEDWKLPDAMCKISDDGWKFIEDIFNQAKTHLSADGAQIFENVDLDGKADMYKWKGKSMFYEISTHQLATKNFPVFFDEFEQSEVYSVKDMMKWNLDHQDQALPAKHPYQTQFYDLLQNKYTQDESEQLLEAFAKEGKQLAKLLERMDAVVALGESKLMMYTSSEGCPVAAVPLGVFKYSDWNRRPFGLSIAVKQGNEGLLLRILAGFQRVMPSRQLPDPLKNNFEQTESIVKQMQEETARKNEPATA